MLRPPHLLAPALLAFGLIGACTNDFSQFEPAGTGGTTTTTTTTAAGGSGGSGGTGASTSSMMGTEDCLDGVDNDGDGDIDCADTADCAGYACVTVPPGGWQGPGIVYAGDPATLPDCPAEFPTVLHDGVADPVQEDATCAPCACDAPTVDCTLGQIRAYGNANCGGGSTPFNQPPVNTCGQINPAGGTDAYRAPAPTVTASACNASGGAATVPPAVAGVATRVCGADLSAAGCGTQEQRCVPDAVVAPFEGTVCVWSDGDQACPGGFTVKHLFGESLDDTRGCTPCTCGNAVTDCNAVTLVYSDNNCQNLLEMVPNDMTCTMATAGLSIMPMWDPMGTCPPDGGQPTGSVALGGALTTVCCR